MSRQFSSEESSRLEVAFADGFVLAVVGEEEIEAWQILGPGRLNVFAGTGRGEPMTFDDSSAVQRFDH